MEGKGGGGGAGECQRDTFIIHSFVNALMTKNPVSLLNRLTLNNCIERASMRRGEFENHVQPNSQFTVRRSNVLNDFFFIFGIFFS